MKLLKWFNEIELLPYKLTYKNAFDNMSSSLKAIHGWSHNNTILKLVEQHAAECNRRRLLFSLVGSVYLNSPGISTRDTAFLNVLDMDEQDTLEVTQNLEMNYEGECNLRGTSRPSISKLTFYVAEFW